MEEDFAAVTGSERVLTGLSGGNWPRGLTLDDNRIDLAWHEREFTARRSFAWIVRDRVGDYLGCAYLYPDPGARGRGWVVTWIRDMPGRAGHLGRFDPLLRAWLMPHLPDGYVLDWINNAELG